MDKIKEIINRLMDKNQTIATMESCTGGALANHITNCPGARRCVKIWSSNIL